MQDFLNPDAALSKSGGLPGTDSARGGAQATPPQDRTFSLRVLLPSRSISTVTVRSNSRTKEVFEVSQKFNFGLARVLLSSF